MNSRVRSGAIWSWAAVLSLAPLTRAAAQDEEAKRKAGLDFYGFVMVDAIFDHTGIKGDWLGAARPPGCRPSRTNSGCRASSSSG